MDITTLGGLLIAILGILGGQALEGGHVGSILQGTAALIILGGTTGAVMVAFPLKDFLRGVKLFGQAFTEKKFDMKGMVAEIVELAGIARKDGVLALEGKLPEIQDPFLKRALQYVVDGVEAEVTRSSLEAAIESEFAENNVAAKVWESAGGFAPTVGILGAVLGLIHVMENLSDPSKLGGGIATAFVATVYGVGSANLLFLPAATKLKHHKETAAKKMNLILEALVAIQQGENPALMKERLMGFLVPADRAKVEKGG